MTSVECEITRRLRSLLASQQSALMKAEDSLAILRAQIEVEKRRGHSSGPGEYSGESSSATLEDVVLHASHVC